jgi:DNA-binding GntR family transcriptional regulator
MVNQKFESIIQYFEIEKASVEVEGRLRKEDISEYVKKNITAGRFQPGERLIEAQLCRELGAGRGLVREALKNLEHEDIVEIIPYKGALIKGLSQRDIAQIYDLMAVLEALAARLATLTITKKELEEIEFFIVEMEQCTDDHAKFLNLNLAFHERLTELGGNERLATFVRSLKDQTNTYRMGLLGFYNVEQQQATLREHRQILAELNNRDPEKVEKLVRQHFTDAKHRLLKFMNKTL